MKTILLAITMLTLVSCTERTEKTVAVIYMNGDKDTLTINSSSIRLDKGDIKTCGCGNTQGVTASGVRSFNVISEKKLNTER